LVYIIAKESVAYHIS